MPLFLTVGDFFLLHFSRQSSADCCPALKNSRMLVHPSAKCCRTLKYTLKTCPVLDLCWAKRENEAGFAAASQFHRSEAMFCLIKGK